MTPDVLGFPGLSRLWDPRLNWLFCKWLMTHGSIIPECNHTVAPLWQGIVPVCDRPGIGTYSGN